MLKIVVIDANAMARGLLTTLLTAAGHEVIGNSNTSPAGLARAIKLAPQLICIDIGAADAAGRTPRWSAEDIAAAGLGRRRPGIAASRYYAWSDGRHRQALQVNLRVGGNSQRGIADRACAKPACGMMPRNDPAARDLTP